MKTDILIKNDSIVIILSKNMINVSPSLKVIREIYNNSKNNNIHEFILDLKKVKSIDDSGIGYILGLYRHIRDSESKMIIKNIPENIYVALKYTGLLLYLEEKENVEVWV